MAQQTAVEFFADKIDSLIPYVNEKTADEFRKLLEQAIQMEKEQTEGAKILGHQEGYKRGYLQHALDKK